MNNDARDVRARSITYIGTAFGLVAGLAWNEAITELINVLFPISKDSIYIKFLYALVLTVAVVMVLKQLEKWAVPSKN